MPRSDDEKRAWREEQELNNLLKANARDIHRARQAYDPDARQRQAIGMARSVSPYPEPKRPRLPDVRIMTRPQMEALAKALLEAHKYDWLANARPEQLMPKFFTIWLLLAGRGFGKTRACAEAVRHVCQTPGMSIAVVAKDHRALRDVCFEGRSGLLAVIPKSEWNTKDYHKGLGDVSLTLKNGSVIRGYTAAEPDAVRGQAFDMIWGDEFAAWPKNRAEDMLKQLRLCLRESENARAILSTTPKRVPHVVKMVKDADDPTLKIVITRGRSRDNTVLTEEWHQQMEREIGGTRLGRQELDGELVMDAEKALWVGEWIEMARWDREDKEGILLPYPTEFVGVITGVDPSGSKDGDATGIATVGWDKDKVIYVIENRTCNGTTGERYGEACRSAYRHGSTEIWYESAYGGDNCAYGIEQAWKELVRAGEIEGRCPIVKPSTIKGDKAARAMPVAFLYEQQTNTDRRRIYHPPPTETNKMAKLEDEMLTWETDAKKSPNAIDAVVHAVRQVLIKTGQEVVLSRPSSKRNRPTTQSKTTGYKVFSPKKRNR